MKTVIDIQGLSVSYGAKMVLRNIYLQIQQGDIYGILGPNGAGKSTLFKAILGLLEPNKGEIKIFDAELSEVRKKIAYIPQKDEVDWSFPATVMDIVLMGRYPFKRFYQRIDEKDRKIAQEVMEELSIFDLRDRQIGQLSGGQQQRVFIARALCQKPDIMLLDEPFVGVDITTENKIVEVLKTQADQGKTFLVVHHDLSKVEEYFDQVVLLNQRLISAGKTSTTFTEDNIQKAYGAQSNILHKL